jgi:glycosyltransferase involved in cell wall biosynthesis
MRLLIISDTKVQKRSPSFFGFNSVVNEINYFLNEFSEIYWIVSDYSDNKFDPSLLPIDSRIKLYVFPRLGGNTFLHKLSSIYYYPRYIKAIVKLLSKVDLIHTRGPNQVSLLALLLSFIFTNKKWWFKYATNWGDKNAPLRNRIERRLLKLNKRIIVTINGFWPNQSKHCLSFENPCISQIQLEKGRTIQKSFNQKLKVVFAGRIEEAKGIDILMEVLETLHQDRFEEWIFIGEGPLKKPLQNVTNDLNINAIFPGFVSQSEVHEYLLKAHILILPSKSEGFPKIVAEAWNYQVIPLVSPVGSLPHYLEHGKNGFMMDDVSKKSLNTAFEQLLKMTPRELEGIAQNGQEMAHKFTFEYYYKHLQEEIFS